MKKPNEWFEQEIEKFHYPKEVHYYEILKIKVHAIQAIGH